MIDPEFLRAHPDVVRSTAQQKRVPIDIDRLLSLDEQRRSLQRERDALGAQRNETAERSARLRRERTDRAAVAALEEAGRVTKEKLEAVDRALGSVTTEFAALFSRVPNLLAPNVPVGKDESENQILRTVGKPPTLDFAPKEHWELGKNLGIIDIERAAKVSGSRFAYLKGDLALLEFALIQHALSILTNRITLQEILSLAGLDLPATPFTPVIPPALIRPTFLEQMARLEPKEERYYLQDDDLYLIGSAEHTLGAMHADEILDQRSLPLRYAGFSSAFRREAGSHGKDVHGILRVHQFDKVELESFTVPEQSAAEQDFLVAIQEHLLQALGLPYRVVLMCTGDMGAPDARQIDIETWFPGQQRYRETHTADLVTDYQARRLGTKVRRDSGEKVYVHMNDATAFAVGRTLAAILENFQQADGRVRVPAALRAALGGREFFGDNS